MRVISTSYQLPQGLIHIFLAPKNNNLYQFAVIMMIINGYTLRIHKTNCSSICYLKEP